MEIQQNFLTGNDCYKAGKKIAPTGIVVHDTGTNQRKVSAYLTSWNKSGVEKCVHAFIGTRPDGSFGVVQTLPWTTRCWGCGSGSKGSYNGDHIQFEICQDDRTDQAWFDQCYAQAVELCAHLCRTYGLSADAIVDHAEAHTKGYASNHSDTGDWFPKFGKSMDTLRADVRTLLEGGSGTAAQESAAQPVAPAAEPETPAGNSAGTDSPGRQFQSWLNANYATGLTVDGLWGPKTRAAAIRALQTELNAQFSKGLVVDGVWGSKTKAACVNVKQGASGNLTRLIQGTLYCRGYDPKGFDGIFGTGCTGAVKSFQSAQSLSADGVVGKNTWEKLLGA